MGRLLGRVDGCLRLVFECARALGEFGVRGKEGRGEGRAGIEGLCRSLPNGENRIEEFKAVVKFEVFIVEARRGCSN